VNGIVAASILVMGGLLSAQPLLNARVAASAGHPIYGALFSVAVSAVTMVVAVLVMRLPAPELRSVAALPAWTWSGGVIGAFVVLFALIATPRLGSATTVALFIAGRLVASMVIDQFGLLGVPQHPLNAGRMLGIGLLVTGVALIRLF
jgi:transporter family-2 protein